MPVIDTLRDRRHRQRALDAPADDLPALTQDQAELLADWASTHARRRAADTLRRVAGPTRLDLVEPLAAALLHAGWARLHERHGAGQWWLQHLEWTDLPRLQQRLGLRTQAEQSEARGALDAQLAALGKEEPALAAAVQATVHGRLSPTRRAARLQLLQGLARWRAEQRSGLLRDFALFARPHTKAISELEWAWLRGHFDLEAWGIEPLAHILWLAGDARLQFTEGGGTLDLAGLPFVGVPQRHLATLRAAGPVRRHWLIENRTCFERQALRLPPGVLLAWLPGRPSMAWCAAWGALLRAAPLPVQISADADPAGIEIALSAGALCEAEGVAWAPHAMEPERLDSGRALPLNAYDRDTLSRLAKQSLPPGLQALAEALHERGIKHEQEAWL